MAGPAAPDSIAPMVTQARASTLGPPFMASVASSPNVTVTGCPASPPQNDHVAYWQPSASRNHCQPEMSSPLLRYSSGGSAVAVAELPFAARVEIEAWAYLGD